MQPSPTVTQQVQSQAPTIQAALLDLIIVTAPSQTVTQRVTCPAMSTQADSSDILSMKCLSQHAIGTSRIPANPQAQAAQP